MMLICGSIRKVEGGYILERRNKGSNYLAETEQIYIKWEDLLRDLTFDANLLKPGESLESYLKEKQ